ncbi:hypothetical protein PITC_081530 [Penicillium italicum]|uniref:Uncharacterized protein n=1 Tax=Penicillium italicum TaxID=40296 RepID=A0A0A2L8B7_PENIT|nr:hypothetical protein PITC_081530 [Penicillium italicum]
MADPTQSYGPGAQKIPSPPIVRTPLSSGSGSGTPISFQTNVNRSKTKRWVEAKQYAYDGGDWGSDDDEEEEEEAPPAVSRPPYATRNTGSSSELSSRRLSAIGYGAGASESNLADGKGRNFSGGDQKTLPFVRPADLSKRMREEKATQQAPITGSNDPKPDGFGVPSQTNQQSPRLGLPEVKRMSSFGADFLGGADSNPPKDSLASQDPPLHHNPSSGFRSVVNQAFDVPETPQSTTTSVTRSNSDGTSTISPIMGARTMTDERAPTILEEPNESSSPKATANAVPVFNPGHRRDLSLPSSDNSPSRKPQVTDQDTPMAGRAELSSIPLLQNLSPESPDTGITQSPSMQPSSNNRQDMPAPLKFGSASGPDAFHGEIPTIMGAEESPQNTDNDRLREEIIRSLSRETTPMEDPEPSNQPQSQAPAESVPHQAIVSDSNPAWTSPPPLPPRDPYTASQGASGNSSSTIIDQPKKPKLERRFSWESSDSSEPDPPQMPGSYSSPPPLATSLSMQEPEPIHEEAAPLVSDVSHDPLASEDEGSVPQRAVERPRLSIVPPIPENIAPPEQVMRPEATLPPQRVSSNAGSSSLDESKLLGFRDILGITSINQRIKSFEHTRDQFAHIDTGLNHWLQFTVHHHPEHADVVRQSQNLSPTVPPSDASRSRFPKLGALSNLGSLNDGAPTNATHIRRPSGHIGTVMNKDKVGEKGKEFLHTAGAFSGKATGAAKGLFAKGRSRFRPSGGSEKVQSTPSASRRSFQFSFPSGSGEASGNSSLRNSVTLGSLPVFKSERVELKSDPDPPASFCLDRPQNEQNSGKRVKATESVNNYLSHDHVDEMTVQPKQLSSSTGVPPKPEVPGKSAFAGDLEQEMIAALGLSPTDSHTQRAASTPMALNSFNQVNGGKHQVTAPLPQPKSTTGNQSDAEAPVNRAAVAKKSLPVIPDEPFHVPFPAVNSQRNQPSKPAPEIVIPSIRPVLDEGPKSPSPPPKDNDNGLAPSQCRRRHPSVSTLGVDEQPGSTSYEELDRDPPSPLRETANEGTPEPWYKSNVEDSMDDASSGSQSSARVKRRTFIPFYPSRSSEFTSSAEALESKRNSISGLPPSAPDFRSPLRNEVRHSPGTRSSMLSFGSFGKQSANGKGTRPSTPANGLSQPSESGSPGKIGESAIGKLKGFGRRRRTSVGDLLSGIQPQGPQAPSAGQNRTFSRISVLFGRQDLQDPERKSTAHARTVSEQLQNKYLPKRPSTSRTLNTSLSAQNEPPVLSNPLEQNRLPTQPPEPTAPPPPPPSDANPLPRDDGQRASTPLPLGSSSNSQAAGRFYSQFQSGSMDETLAGSRHLSQPLPGHSRSPSPMSYPENRAAHPLSPFEELQGSQIRELQEEEDGERLRHELHAEIPEAKQNHPGQHELHGDPTQQSLAPQLSVRSRKPVSDSTSPAPENRASRNIAVSNTSVHPHRSENEARLVNDPPQPVELAITADDSSEEIVMSPTFYPGQEWTPMHL